MRTSSPPRFSPPSRNDESSQMFTLAALVGRATSAPPPMSPSTAPGASVRPSPVAVTVPRREGSGVIDLNALARAAEERARRAQSEPPPSAFAREARMDEPPPATSRKLRFAGIAAAAGVLAIVGLIVAVSGGDEPKPARAAAAAAQVGVGVGAPKADTLKTEAPKVEILASATPAQDTTPASQSVAQSPRSGGGKWSAGARKGAKIASGPKVNMSKITSGGLGAQSSPAPVAAAKPAKPAAGADPCNCKGNLQCAIKCFK